MIDNLSELLRNTTFQNPQRAVDGARTVGRRFFSAPPDLVFNARLVGRWTSPIGAAALSEIVARLAPVGTTMRSLANSRRSGAKGSMSDGSRSVSVSPLQNIAPALVIAYPRPYGCSWRTRKSVLGHLRSCFPMGVSGPRAVERKLAVDVNVVGHGIDLVDIAELRRWIEDPRDPLVPRCFVQAELDEIDNGPTTSSVWLVGSPPRKRLSKALDTGFGAGVAFSDVVIHRAAGAPPQVHLSGGAEKVRGTSRAGGRALGGRGGPGAYDLRGLGRRCDAGTSLVHGWANSPAEGSGVTTRIRYRILNARLTAGAVRGGGVDQAYDGWRVAFQLEFQQRVGIYELINKDKENGARMP
jgi:phosphopantetheinyl transferase (holo-ACP synthase)